MNLQALVSTMASKLGARGLDKSSPISFQNVVILSASMICILAPLEISQLAFALIGALVYAVLQAFSPRPPKTNCQLAAAREQRERERAGEHIRAAPYKQPPMHGGAMRPRPSGSRIPHAPSATVVKPDVYQPSAAPVSAPKFESTGWEAEVHELIAQLTPGADEDEAVQRLVLHVKQTIQPLFPEVEVTGFVHSSLKCGKAFGVAVPEAEIVANVSPVLLAQRLQQRAKSIGAKQLQKSSVRACTDSLVSSGGLKFRRSAFRGDEPRVTLLVPKVLGFFSDAIPIDFSVNSITPFYTAALLTECGQMEPRAKTLILLVKRWAKDRGICHSAKGHLSPYLWSLLVMYFLQVGVVEEGPLLPKLEAFKVSSHLITPSEANSLKSPAETEGPFPAPSGSTSSLSVAQLFSKFVQFYGQRFNWRNEAISIRRGKRAPPALSLPLHVILSEDASKRSQVGPAIEDPFKACNNLGTCMNSLSLARLHEELARACDLCARGASLTEVLEPWVPAEDVRERSGGSSPSEQDDDTCLKSSRKT